MNHAQLINIFVVIVAVGFGIGAPLWVRRYAKTSGTSGIIDAMLAWLAIMDSGAYARSWELAAPYFQSAVTKEEWISKSKQIRQPLAAVRARNLNSVRFLQAGTWCEAKFNTTFAGLPDATETVTFSQQAGAWKAIGYFIKPTVKRNLAAWPLLLFTILCLTIAGLVAGLAWLTWIVRPYGEVPLQTPISIPRPRVVQSSNAAPAPNTSPIALEATNGYMGFIRISSFDVISQNYLRVTYYSVVPFGYAMRATASAGGNTWNVPNPARQSEYQATWDFPLSRPPRPLSPTEFNRGQQSTLSNTNKELLQLVQWLTEGVASIERKLANPQIDSTTRSRLEETLKHTKVALGYYETNDFDSLSASTPSTFDSAEQNEARRQIWRAISRGCRTRASSGLLPASRSRCSPSPTAREKSGRDFWNSSGPKPIRFSPSHSATARYLSIAHAAARKRHSPHSLAPANQQHAHAGGTTGFNRNTKGQNAERVQSNPGEARKSGTP